MFENALKIFNWQGRICRRQYLLVLALVCIVDVILINATGAAQTFMILGQLVLVPSQIKRLHDIGWSGWVILAALIPGLNLILGFGLLLFAGTKGPNKYGADPHK